MRAYDLYDRVFPRISALDISVNKGNPPSSQLFIQPSTVSLVCNMAGRTSSALRSGGGSGHYEARLYGSDGGCTCGGDVGGDGHTRSGSSDAGRTTAAATELREGTRSSLGSRSQRSSGDQPL